MAEGKYTTTTTPRETINKTTTPKTEKEEEGGEDREARGRMVLATLMGCSTAEWTVLPPPPQDFSANFYNNRQKQH
jgi:hypothetical protein